MDIPQTYIAIAIVVLMVIALLVFLTSKNRKEMRLSPLASLAFGFILAGILFADNGLVGYGLIGVGVLLAVLDIFRNRNKTI
jgi:lipopolysaccharide export LptBFGC system permease protein LptF